MIDESKLISHVLKLKESSFDYKIQCVHSELVKLNKIIIKILQNNDTCTVKGSKTKLINKATDIALLPKSDEFIKKDYDIITSDPYQFINKLIKGP